MRRHGAQIYTFVVLALAVLVASATAALLASRGLPDAGSLVLWILAPYAVGAAMLWPFRIPVVAAGWVTLPFVVNLYLLVGAFIPPSIDDFAFGAAAAIDLFLLGPIGALVAWQLRSRREC
jgi:hypothetical protein